MKDLTPAERLLVVEEALEAVVNADADAVDAVRRSWAEDALEALRGMEVKPGATQRGGGLFYYAEPRHPRDRPAALLTLRDEGTP